MLNRRDAMIRLGQIGLGAITLPGLLGSEALGAAARSSKARAKSCIYLFLWGGPPQQDLWDMKPDAPEGVRSLFKPSQTVVPGIGICDQLPLLARHTDKLAIVRSVTHDSNLHEFGCHRMLTGKKLPDARRFPGNNRRRSDEPFVGSALAQFSPPGALPNLVTVPRPLGHDGVTYAGTHGGFLGPRCDPMELKGATGYNGDVTFRDQLQQPTHPLTLPADVDAGRLRARQSLLQVIEAHDRILQENRGAQVLGSFYEQAIRMVASTAAKRAFDLDLEPAKVRERYGRNEYGDSFLLARRLVEAGVRLVNVNWMYIFPDGKLINVWDNHAGYNVHGAKTGYDLLKGPACCQALDRAGSALLEDLSLRGLLDETLVVACGEFGRSPKIMGGGRDHWGACQSVLLAGGGIQGGQVYGASDSHAAYPKDNPVAPEDLIATIYHAFGIAPDAEVHDRENRPHRLCEGRPLTTLFRS